MKKENKRFTVMDYEKEAEYLSSMHAKGWKFKQVKYLGTYYFEECEPAEYSYQLDYNQDAANEKEEYIQMFADCGWEYLQDFVGYSYFRKPVGEGEEREEIFCDDESRIEMMKRVFRGRIVPLIILFFCLIMNCINFGMRSTESTFGMVMLILNILLMVVYVGMFASFYRKYKAFMEKMGRL